MAGENSQGDALGPIRKLLLRKSKFAVEGFSQDEEGVAFLAQCRVLVVGAGGLGCEILKGLAMTGFRDIHVIDMDEVDLTNLNRQFLFRHGDVGKPKAQVAAEFIRERCGHLGVKVEAFVGKIQDKPASYYKQFNLVIAGLDNVAARRWLNSLLHDLLERDADGEVVDGTMIPLLDGGTEGFKGQARVLLPGVTSCFECSLSTLPPQTNFPLCTIAETPRLPEHCIEYAMVKLWDEHFPSRALNKDSAEDMRWLYDQAVLRADRYGIQGVTYQLTMGVVKRIIPAVASTNALVSAQLVAEAFKLATCCAGRLDNYMMYMGHDGVYSYTFEYQKDPQCLVCGVGETTRSAAEDLTLQQLMDMLVEDRQLQLNKPSISAGNHVLYMQGLMSCMYTENLSKTLAQLMQENVLTALNRVALLLVTDPSMANPLKIQLTVTTA